MAIGHNEALKLSRDEEVFIKAAEDEIDFQLTRKYNGELSFTFIIEDSKRLAPLFEKVWREELVLKEVIRKYSELKEDGWYRIDLKKNEKNEKHEIHFIRP